MPTMHLMRTEWKRKKELQKTNKFDHQSHVTNDDRKCSIYLPLLFLRVFCCSYFVWRFTHEFIDWMRLNELCVVQRYTRRFVSHSNWKWTTAAAAIVPFTSGELILFNQCVCVWCVYLAFVWMPSIFNWPISRCFAQQMITIFPFDLKTNEKQK